MSASHESLLPANVIHSEEDLQEYKFPGFTTGQKLGQVFIESGIAALSQPFFYTLIPYHKYIYSMWVLSPMAVYFNSGGPVALAGGNNVIGNFYVWLSSVDTWATLKESQKKYGDWAAPVEVGRYTVSWAATIPAAYIVRAAFPIQPFDGNPSANLIFSPIGSVFFQGAKKLYSLKFPDTPTIPRNEKNTYWNWLQKLILDPILGRMAVTLFEEESLRYAVEGLFDESVTESDWFPVVVIPLAVLNDFVIHRFYSPDPYGAGLFKSSEIAAFVAKEKENKDLESAVPFQQRVQARIDAAAYKRIGWNLVKWGGMSVGTGLITLFWNQMGVFSFGEKREKLSGIEKLGRAACVNTAYESMRGTAEGLKSIIGGSIMIFKASTQSIANTPMKELSNEGIEKDLFLKATTPTK